MFVKKNFAKNNYWQNFWLTFGFVWLVGARTKVRVDKSPIKKKVGLLSSPFFSIKKCSPFPNINFNKLCEKIYFQYNILVPICYSNH